jgi:hypothetical protein
VCPIFIRNFQRLADEQSAESRAVDEQVAFDALAGLQNDSFDKPVFPAQLDVYYFALNPLYAALLRVAAQVFRVKRGIELVRIRKSCCFTSIRRAIERLCCAGGAQRIVVQFHIAAAGGGFTG